MTIKLEPIKLSVYLWRWGPFIYFFNGECRGPNEEIVKYMNAMACVYPKLKVFEIQWKKQISRFPKTPFENLNKIYLYFDGLERMNETKPNENQIRNIFNTAVEFHNLKIERLANNVGTKGPRTTDTSIEDSQKEKVFYGMSLSEIRRNRNKYLGMKIEKLNNDEIEKILFEKIQNYPLNLNKSVYTVQKTKEINNQKSENPETVTSKETHKIETMCNYSSNYNKQNIDVNYQKTNTVLRFNKIYVLNANKIIHMSKFPQFQNIGKIKLIKNILENKQISNIDKINNSYLTTKCINKTKLINKKNIIILKSNPQICKNVTNYNYKGSDSFINKDSENKIGAFKEEDDIKALFTKDKNSSQWFQDVKFDNLPEDIFDEK